MIKILYSELGLLNFQQTVQKLANSQLRDPVAFQIKFVTKGLREGFFKMKEEYKKEIEAKYAVKNETGQVVEATVGKSLELNLPFQCNEEHVADAKGALDEFNKRTCQIDRKKIPFEIIFQCNEWSPRELEALEHIVTEPGDA